ncbi:hypothetical protein IB227_15785 [Stenotrophomonas sp. STM01]|uniref:hypothetical protein n=1 Tax=Stenotrophomonas sp. STM01 TaxID=2769278 RepID=UPI0017856A56|nr:hypothetical protein [Stenotrophomonas sp. STM01]MBD9537310.1 hypothetical protein [Stenotrophomonas sp. STM01]
MNSDDETAASMRAANEAWLSELLASLRACNLSDTLIYYPSFLELSTFGPEHTNSDRPWYRLHEDEKGIEVEISAGAALPLDFHDWTKEEAAIAAEFRKSAYIKLPASAELVACWIYNQAGDIEFAVGGEPGATTTHWVDAISEIAGGLTSVNTSGLIRTEPSMTSAEVRSAGARHAAKAKVKLDKDGKQAAKAQAKELWKEWKGGRHPKLRTTEHFATEVMRRWPVLKNAETIRKWSAAWRKELGKV